MQSTFKIDQKETAWGSLPAHVQRCFSSREHQVYVEGVAKLIERVRSAQEPALSAFLDMRSDKGMTVYIEREDDQDPMVWFGVNFPYATCHTQFSISAGSPGFDQYPRLQRLYSSFGGIRAAHELDAGLLPPQRWYSCVPPGVLECRGGEGAARAFFGCGNGDYIVSDSSGRVVAIYEHETDSINEVEVDAVLDEFFAGLTKLPWQQ